MERFVGRQLSLPRLRGSQKNGKQSRFYHRAGLGAAGETFFESVVKYLEDQPQQLRACLVGFLASQDIGKPGAQLIPAVQDAFVDRAASSAQAF
jgi:hypothetical protein